MGGGRWLSERRDMAHRKPHMRHLFLFQQKKRDGQKELRRSPASVNCDTRPCISSSPTAAIAFSNPRLLLRRHGDSSTYPQHPSPLGRPCTPLRECRARGARTRCKKACRRRFPSLTYRTARSTGLPIVSDTSENGCGQFGAGRTAVESWAWVGFWTLKTTVNYQGRNPSVFFVQTKKGASYRVSHGLRRSVCTRGSYIN